MVVVAHLLVQTLKLPLAASVLVDLVPPPKTHEEPPAHVLHLQRKRKGKASLKAKAGQSAVCAPKEQLNLIDEFDDDASLRFEPV